MIYIQAYGGYNSIEDKIDLKALTKQITGQNFRRIDHFIQLGLIGVGLMMDGRDVPENTSIYISSGQSDLSVIQRLRDQKFVYNKLPMPIDFINSVSNSAGFYIAKFVKCSGKNIFVSHHRFTFESSLQLAISDIMTHSNRMAIVGGVDELIEPISLGQRIHGVNKDTIMGEGSNWLLLGSEEKNALASIDCSFKPLDKEGLKNFIVKNNLKYLSFSGEFGKDLIKELLEISNGAKQFHYEETCGYYETVSAYVLRYFLETKNGSLLHINYSNGQYSTILLQSCF